MNNFTKEELIKLKNGIEYLPQSVNLSTQYLQDCQAIITKIESLIDNYCDHTPSDAHYEQFRWQLCFKCGVQYK